MKKKIRLFFQFIVFHITHLGQSPASRQWDWENRDCPNNRAKRKRKERDLGHIEHECVLKATGRI